VLRAHLVALAARTPLLAGIDQRCFIDIDSLLRPVYGHAKQTSHGESLSSGSGLGVVRPGGRFVVSGAGIEAAVQDADEPVAKLTKRSAMPNAAPAEIVVIGAGSGRCGQRAEGLLAERVERTGYREAAPAQRSGDRCARR
jgi:hypothetical protein